MKRKRKREGERGRERGRESPHSDVELIRTTLSHAQYLHVILIIPQALPTICWAPFSIKDISSKSSLSRRFFCAPCIPLTALLRQPRGTSSVSVRRRQIGGSQACLQSSATTLIPNTGLGSGRLLLSPRAPSPPSAEDCNPPLGFRRL